MLGILAACGAGFGIPLLAVLLGNLGQTFIDITKALQNETLSQDDKDAAMHRFIDSMMFNCLIYLILGFWSMFTNFSFRSSIYYVSECLINRFRTAFVAHLLKLDAVEFDKTQTGQFTVLLNYDTERIREGLNDRLGYLIVTVMESSLATIIAFVTNWKLALLASLMNPLLIFLSTAIYKLSSNTHDEMAKEYEKAGAICSQVLGNIKTVIACNGQTHEITEYRKYLGTARSCALKFRTMNRIIYATSVFAMYFIEFIAYYFGTFYVYNGSLKGGEVVRVLFSIFFASQCFKEGGRTLTQISISIASTKRLVEMMQMKSKIEGQISELGKSVEISEGRIEFSDIHFSYPARNSISVLNGMAFSVAPGKKLAIVGASGSGKSSIIQLLLRHYEQNSGTIKIDGHSLNEFDLSYLRQKIGVVSQEPVLFSGTIEENILFSKPSASKAEIIDALRKANAYDFVMTFPKGVKTLVGERGTQLSGGQKQRIAIARALIRQPEILLFDEATSAIDSENEAIVQKALENACIGKTAITIAHRLATIRNADQILVINKGEVVESGTHQELVDKRGEYYEMLMAQSLTESEQKDEKFDGKDPVLRQFSNESFADAMDFQLGHLCGVVSGLILAVTVSFMYGWRMAILTSTTFPFLVYVENKLTRLWQSSSHKDRKALEAASRVAIEAIESIKTVRSLTMERSVVDKFAQLTEISLNANKKKAKVQALVFAMSGSALYFIYCVNYAFGAYLVYNGLMPPLSVYIVLFSIAEVMRSANFVATYIPDYVKAMYSTGLIFNILDEKSPIDNLTESGAKPEETTEMSLDGIEFRYPQRPNETILKDFSLLFPSGKTTALVGASGSGKSTVIQLLERFYDPNSGHLCLGRTPLIDIQPKYLRSKLSLVSQEPVLFDRTIRDNIVYGLEERNISNERIHQVLELANIKGFVDTLPLGIDTMIGSAKLSGGQKQRIAISRALIRNPDILLLDEATSAMDSQNEALVQAALDKASATRTTVIVAHRLSTVANADRIVVIKHGNIVEQGSPTELMEKKGVYWKMVQRQSGLINKKNE
ncbi:hypothetical protein WR25_02646 isoform C [Diploscapter pachys]|uniref:Bile salt export pump n=1 Tax=Diploscapter pachys TaxID=2018661 RepID=A0A2A2KET1_9BILA|nr:hypothetical protein WR25_02646 isoform C [Diploscapter pachys]